MFLFCLESVEFIWNVGWYVGFLKKSNLENYIFTILYHCIPQIYFIISPHFLSSLFMTLISSILDYLILSLRLHWYFSAFLSVFQFVVSTASSSSSLIFPSVVTIMLKNSPSELFISNTVSSSSRLYIVLSNSFYLSTEIIHKFTCHVSLYL